MGRTTNPAITAPITACGAIVKRRCDGRGSLGRLNGETYLRLLIERVVEETAIAGRAGCDRRQVGGWLGQFHRAGEALIAAEVVDQETTEEMRADLTLALAVRGLDVPGGLEPQHLGRWKAYPIGPPAAEGAPQPIERVVRACPAELESDNGTLNLRFVVIEGDRAQLHATAYIPGGLPGAGWSSSKAIARPAPVPVPSGALGVTNIHRRVWSGGSFVSMRGSPGPHPPPPPTPSQLAQPPVAGPPQAQAPPGRAPWQTPPMAMGGRGGPFGPGFDAINVFDDAGTPYTAMGGSSGGDGVRWTLSFHVMPAPPADTAALRFQVGLRPPVRVRLVPPPQTVTVTMEDVPAAERWSRGERFLLDSAERSFLWWQRSKAHGGSPGPPTDDIAIDALIATGALDPASRAVGMLNALGAFQRGEPNPPGLPPRWASALANIGAADGPVGTAVIGAAVPALAKPELLWLDALTSDPDTWRLHTFIRPGFIRPGPGPFGTIELSFHATDDRGGFYVGAFDGGGGGSEGVSMWLRFVPRLDPQASVVTLQASGLEQRATVSVPLPKPWTP